MIRVSVNTVETYDEDVANSYLKRGYTLKEEFYSHYHEKTKWILQRVDEK